MNAAIGIGVAFVIILVCWWLARISTDRTMRRWKEEARRYAEWIAAVRAHEREVE